ncbi:DUF2474 domain-containing protein [Legionella pneumophila]|nr:DUF2474 domain-containing protein [Legionella pneumophila]HAT8881730.1 DUF2474 family protein [Legionella pneumophila subsp. pneumophila]MDW9140762.1 DUF2474 domain-containing protein [Legionella pneumophila]RYB43620.1 DUF2474 domain-containing protein [Legionella pneumophila]RYB70273.1 DUF2474 domain-containing protein [Legionella pneumophila]RYB75747.1 DUF2474 domain-containing protein [Legionella pneumophila]
MKTLWWKRLGWLITIWGSSVGILTLISLFFRCLMAYAGLKT